MNRPLTLATFFGGVLLLATGCEGEEEPVESGGVIIYSVAGQTYEERTVVNAITSDGFLAIGWNESPGGDLGEDFYGSLTLSQFTGTGTYAPMTRMSDIDAVIEIADGEGGSLTYYPLANEGLGDGSLEVLTFSETGATGTFMFTGDRVGVPDEQPIEGTFDVTFGDPQ